MRKTGPKPEKLLVKKEMALKYLVEGLEERDIAEKMGIALSTVKRYLLDPVIVDRWIEVRRDVIGEAKEILMKEVVPVSESLVDIALNARSEMARYRACIFVLKIFGIQPPKISVTLEKKQIVIMKKIIGE